MFSAEEGGGDVLRGCEYLLGEGVAAFGHFLGNFYPAGQGPASHINGGVFLKGLCQFARAFSWSGGVRPTCKNVTFRNSHTVLLHRLIFSSL
jgi:hypothetical protein